MLQDRSSAGATRLQLLPSVVPELTGLRGVAVILVTLFHGDYPRLVGGSLGVDIFFVLSGFLITSLLIREQTVHGNVSLRNFYVRRILRLGPALVLMLVGVTGFACLFVSQTFRHTAVDAFIALIYATNWSRAFLLHEPIFFGHAWSLSIEEQFYILWPVVFLLLARCSGRTRLIAVLALAVIPMVSRGIMQHAGAPLVRIYNGTDTRADDLMIGCALAILLSEYGHRLASSTRLRASLKYASVGAIVLLLTLSVAMKQVSAFCNYFGYTLIQLACCIIIIDALRPGDGAVKRILCNRVLRWFGKISYSLYLWHWPAVVIITYYGFNKKQTSAMALAGALLMATLSYYVVETKFLRMKSLFESDRRNKVGATDVETVSPNAAG